jgi:hypothetical protein
MIAAKVNEMKPRPSDNVTVLDQAIGITPLAPTEEKQQVETWQYYLYGTIIRDAGEVLLENYLAAEILRPDGVIARDSLFEEDTQLIGTTEITFNKIKKITLNVTTDVRGGNSFVRGQYVGGGIYRGGLKVILSMYHFEGTRRVVDREYEMNVNQNGATRQFTPPGTDIYYLRISAVERL